MDTPDRAQAPNSSQPAVEPRPKASDEPAPLQPEYDYIDEAVEETMIASDPPSFTPHTTIGPPRHAGPAQDQGD
jgi:hypothetical protein